MKVYTNLKHNYCVMQKIKIYKGLSKDVVREAFKWDENFMIEEAPKYPQAPGSASGV